jgi:hypothetical protein
MVTVKATDLVDKKPDQNDYPNPELNPFCFVMYVKCYQTGF